MRIKVIDKSVDYRATEWWFRAYTGNFKAKELVWGVL